MVNSERFQLAEQTIVIRALDSDGEARACARIMSTSEPWVTLGRTYEESLEIVCDASREVYVAATVDAPEVLGFVIIELRGTFIGYIRSVAIREDWRGRGLGSRLIGFAETRILRDHPNVFLLVSSFNPRAKALYERLGYEVVGELRDYVLRGHSEWLLRKSISPLADFTTSRQSLAFVARRD
jgi:ribosomal protein S18 acetylase RimI-like enzyme